MAFEENDLVKALGAVEGKLDLLVTMVREEVSDRKRLDGRVRALERKWAYGLGLGSAISAIVAMVVSPLSSHFWK